MRKGRQDPDGQIAPNAENKKSDLAEVSSGVLQRAEVWNYLKPGFILSEEREVPLFRLILNLNKNDGVL